MQAVVWGQRCRTPCGLGLRLETDMRSLRARWVGAMCSVLLWMRWACLRLGRYADTVAEVGLGHEARPFAGRPDTRRGMPVRQGRDASGRQQEVTSYDEDHDLRAVTSGLDPQDGQLCDTEASRMPRTGWSVQGGPGGPNALPDLQERGESTPVKPSAANCQQGAAADDGRAQAEFGRAPRAVIAVSVRSHCWGRCHPCIRCSPLRMDDVGVRDRLTFGGRIGTSRMGEQVHQAESEDQQQEQPADCPSPCSHSASHALRSLAVAPT